MGRVYAAEHVDLERKVALKLLSKDFSQAPDVVEQFRQEARAASKIGNPYICDVTDFGSTPDGRVFFIMEYLDGRSLAAVIASDGPLPAERAIPVLRQVAKALGAAHAKGIIHLDVKPDNVMVFERAGRADAVKVVDFGLAGLLHDGRQAERIAGTPEYMAPERLLAQRCDHRADVYSLGALGYEAFAGAAPLRGSTIMKTLEMQMKAAPAPLAQRAPEGAVSSEIEALVMQMLGKDPATRPSSMAVVEAMLCEAQIAAGLTTAWDDLELPAVDEAWRDRLADRMPSPRGRPKRAVIAAALAVTAVALGVAVYFGVVRKPKEVVKLVPFEVTRTEEPEAVVSWLAKAERAARGERYTKPAGDAAIDYLRGAETEARRLGRQSAGAGTLRRAYASALAVVGNELLKADLRDLAAVKFREALAFEPGDPDLQAKADLSAEEKNAYAARARGSQSERRAAEATSTAVDPARALAADVFMAATKGRFSEARAGVKALAKLDAESTAAARLADGLRRRAKEAWDAGRKTDAHPLYQLVAELDPQDLEARSRSAAGTDTEGAPAPVPPVAAEGSSRDAGKRRRGAQAEEPTDAPRDVAGSEAAARAGQDAMARARLVEAEAAFNRAVRLDPLNPAAIAGLAEVAFERARYPDALDYARRAVRIAPKAWRHLLLLGDAYFKLLRYAEALAAYQRAQALAPENDTIGNRLERVRAKLGRK